MIDDAAARRETSAEAREARRFSARALMRAYAAGALTGAALLLLASCGPSFTNKNIDVVNREFAEAETIGKGGVSPKEVESILGPPKRVEPYRLQLQTQKKELDGVRYYYVQDGETLELHFLDNKLISRVPKLGLPKQTGEPTDN